MIAVVVVVGFFGSMHWRSIELRKEKDYSCQLQQSFHAQHPGEGEFTNKLLDGMAGTSTTAPDACR